MGKHTVQCDSALFIPVKALIQKMPQETAVLRNAFAEHALRGHHIVRRVF